jgi:hypothetical protein
MSERRKETEVRARLRQIIEQGGAHDGGQVLDLRELEAPGPLEHVLLRVASLGAGDSFVAWTPRVPQLLLPKLLERGCQYLLESAPDGSALVYIERP